MLGMQLHVLVMLSNLIHKNGHSQVVVRSEPRHTAESAISVGVERALNLRYHLNQKLQLLKKKTTTNCSTHLFTTWGFWYSSIIYIIRHSINLTSATCKHPSLTSFWRESFSQSNSLELTWIFNSQWLRHLLTRWEWCGRSWNLPCWHICHNKQKTPSRLPDMQCYSRAFQHEWT